MLKQDSTDWSTYIEEQADSYGVPLYIVDLIFDVLGPSEAYDGFIAELQDYADAGGYGYEDPTES